MRVGVLCEHGRGVPQSCRDALEWYEGAKAGEDIAATMRLLH